MEYAPSILSYVLDVTESSLQTYTEETPVSMLSVTAAQRYSVLVTARNDTNSNWAIHANMDPDMFDSMPPWLNPSTSALSRPLFRR